MTSSIKSLLRLSLVSLIAATGLMLAGTAQAQDTTSALRISVSDQGGAPAEIRKMKPEHIRAFHAANYHFGSNLDLIAALPGDYAAREFLEVLNDIIDSVEPQQTVISVSGSNVSP